MFPVFDKNDKHIGQGTLEQSDDGMRVLYIEANDGQDYEIPATDVEFYMDWSGGSRMAGEKPQDAYYRIVK